MSKKWLIPALVLAQFAAVHTSCKPAKTPYLEAAEKAAAWIRAAAVSTPSGTAWPAVPGDPESVSLDLYSGVPGVVLFFVEAAHSTGKKEYLDAATSGADCLLAEKSPKLGPGLYTGLSGIAFALEETYKATNEPKYREGFLDCLREIRAAAVEAGAGIEWGATTDIISGTAGTGLFLLYAHRETGDRRWLDLAARAGDRLVELGKPEGRGVKWAMDPSYPRLMPNFSHGTAGIAYFLATLFLETGERRFLEAALAGGRHLLEVAETGDGVCLVFHHEPGGEDLFYLGWCHGPVGTARLFYRLHQATEDPSWLDWVRRSAEGIRRSGIPEKETPGFWNNAGICCGLAGVGEFFLDLGGVFGGTSDRHFVERVTKVLMNKASVEEGRLSWVQAEHRTRPEELLAQTGYMQGAAGIGMFLLRLDAAERGAKRRVVFPDTPFER
jgi:lantibiotic modifying enzyme